MPIPPARGARAAQDTKQGPDAVTFPCAGETLHRFSRSERQTKPPRLWPGALPGSGLLIRPASLLRGTDG